MQITTTRYYLTLIRMPVFKSPQITNAGKDVEKRKHSYTVGGNVNWCSPYETICGGLKKLKMGLSYDPVTPILGI